MSGFYPSSLIGFGHAVPKRQVFNAEIEAELGLDHGWIERRTGIRSRYWVEEKDCLTDLAAQAGRMALEHAAISPSEIGMVILATSTPDHLLPPSAPLLAHKLGLTCAGAVDLAGACSGFLHALVLGDGLVRTQGQMVLIVAANILSRRINRQERASAIIFGDAAGAVVLAPSGHGYCHLVSSALTSDGSYYDLISIPAGETLMTMRDGRTMFAQAVRIMTECGRKVLHQANIAPDAIRHFVPHQANARIFDAVASQLQLNNAVTARTITDYGNSSAATIPLSLSLGRHQYHKGDLVLLTAAGAGLNGGAALLHFNGQNPS